MKPPLTSAFGKLRRDDAARSSEVTDWHPLVDHCVDVASCFEALLSSRAIRDRAHRLAERSLDDADVARLTAFAFLHDLGKTNSGFQAKRFRVDALPRGVEQAGHGDEAVALFNDDADRALLLELPLDSLEAWSPDHAFGYLHASLSHHGRPLRSDPAPSWSSHARHWAAAAHNDPRAELQRLTRALREFVPLAFGRVDRPLPRRPAFVHFFAGLVQLADWLGSDTRFFPYSEGTGNDRAKTSRTAAYKACCAIGLNVEVLRSYLSLGSFESVFTVPAARPSQIAASDPETGPLVILESETGSGKTEAALWRFLRLFERGRVDALYFALPTRVAATQLYRRVLDMAQRAFGENAPLVVRALPGYAAADGQHLECLASFEALWADRPDDVVAHRRWAAENPKRFLAAPLAVGTVDQALLSTLRVRHAHLRHATLARSLLVIDEVHASDAYMSALIERLLRSHVAAGGEALLLSATLGSRARERFVAAASGGGLASPTEVGRCMTVPYPAVSDRSGLRSVEGGPMRKTIDCVLTDDIDDPTAIAAAAIAAASAGAKVLVIRNTVPAAVAVARAVLAVGEARAWMLDLGGVETLHHGRFAREDRPRLDARVEAVLGKRRPEGPRIVIGTQTLEQSLDIDADWLITDLCPMDVLLQRLGRLHRHVRAEAARPFAYRRASVRVLTPAGGELVPMLSRPRHGLGRFRNGGGVYADLRVLEATRRQLISNPTINIPDDNRRLVEACTHPDALQSIAAECGETWSRHGADIDGEAGAARSVAALQALDVDVDFDRMMFPDDVAVATRLGASDRLVRFPSSPLGPFGDSVREIAIRHHLLPDFDPDDGEARDVSHREGGGFAFTVGRRRFIYDRFGLSLSTDA